VQRTSIYLDDQTLKSLKLLAVASGTTVSDKIREAVEALMTAQVGSTDWRDKVNGIMERLKSRDLPGLSGQEITKEVRAVRSARTRARSGTVNELTRKIRAYEAQLRTLGVDRLSVFGSFARGEQRPDSDCDVLVHFAGDKRGGYFDLGRIKGLLEKSLGLEFDVEFEDCVPAGHPLWRDIVHVF
jgi:predicted nucleotidyltransferase